MNDIRNFLAPIRRLENKIRNILSHKPFLYAFIGSLGVVLIWRGIWVIADDLNLPGWLSLLIGIIISAMTGLFVSLFVGDKIIISGIMKEKRIEEKTEDEIKEEIEGEEVSLNEIKEDIEEIKNDILKNKK
jgi:hypothetical protein